MNALSAMLWRMDCFFCQTLSPRCSKVPRWDNMNSWTDLQDFQANSITHKPRWWKRLCALIFNFLKQRSGVSFQFQFLKRWYREVSLAPATSPCGRQICLSLYESHYYCQISCYYVFVRPITMVKYQKCTHCRETTLTITKLIYIT